MYDGFILNHEADRLPYEYFDQDLQEAFIHTWQSGEDTEVLKSRDNGLKETHRFISYQAEGASGVVTKRIINAKYSNVSELALIKKNSTQFVMMLGVGTLTSSIGATIQQEAAEEEGHLFECADRALYMSKERGKDDYTYLVPVELAQDSITTELETI